MQSFSLELKKLVAYREACAAMSSQALREAMGERAPPFLFEDGQIPTWDEVGRSTEIWAIAPVTW